MSGPDDLVLDPCPLCGTAVKLTGGTHQQIAPEGVKRESGICEKGHRLNRVAGIEQAEWEPVGDEPWGDDRPSG